MIVATVKEKNEFENRVSITPDTCKSYIKAGLDVIIEKNAGYNASFLDGVYKDSGAKVLDREQVLQQADILISVSTMLENSDLEILGELPFFYTGTGYKVKPIISKLNNNVFLEETLKPDLNEIEKIFIADAEELLSPINHFRIKAPENSLMNMTWKVKYKNENISFW